jgi:hypothetical protein
MHLQPLNTLLLLAVAVAVQMVVKPPLKLAGALEATGHRKVFPFLVGLAIPSQ